MMGQLSYQSDQFDQSDKIFTRGPIRLRGASNLAINLVSIDRIYPCQWRGKPKLNGPRGVRLLFVLRYFSHV